MHENNNFRLDIKPDPEQVLYINDDALAETLCDPIEKCPEGNIRVYVPLNLNPEIIMERMYALYDMLGEPDDDNETFFITAVDRIISQLEIYNKVRSTREINRCEAVVGLMVHPDTIYLAKEMIALMVGHLGCAESFPFEEIQRICSTYGLDYPEIM